MRTISIRLEDLQKIVLPLGFEGENQYTQVRIDSKTIYDEFPNATPGLTVVPPIGDAYPGVATRDGDIIVWKIVREDEFVVLEMIKESVSAFFFCLDVVSLKREFEPVEKRRIVLQKHELFLYRCLEL